jgi:DNA-binding transcriptional LysR family regulator
MEWRDWELFCEVVEHGGFTAAARVLGHPKSSLSAAVQRLEANLGLRLIERTTRHLRLTDAGETIYRKVRPLFAALHDTHSEALAMSGAVAGTLRIKAPYEFGAHHAGPVACEVMSRYPELAIRIDVEHDIVNPIAENYDIVFAMLEAPLPSAGIIIRRVFTLERGLFASPALLEKYGEPHAGGAETTPAADRPQRPAMGDHCTRRCGRASRSRQGAPHQFERACPPAGSARRSRRAASDRELHPRGSGSRSIAAAVAGPCLRAPECACAAAGAAIRSGQGTLLPRRNGGPCAGRSRGLYQAVACLTIAATMTSGVIDRCG